jgi:hypothetical protein
MHNISPELRARLISVFGYNPVAVWGSESGPRNRGAFARMERGDDVLIVEGAKVKLLGKIAAKIESAEPPRELWKPLGRESELTWELVA